MPKRTHHKSKHPQSKTSALLRNPIVQIGIVAVIALVIYLLAVSAGGSSGGLPATVSVDEAYAMYQEGGTFFVDVRELSEWDEYHAPGTTLIPLGELASRLNEIPRDMPIVVVCRSGNRSQEGRDILLEAGFTQVTSMAGGLKEWRTAGYPIEP